MYYIFLEIVILVNVLKKLKYILGCPRDSAPWGISIGAFFKVQLFTLNGSNILLFTLKNWQKFENSTYPY